MQLNVGGLYFFALFTIVECLHSSFYVTIITDTILQQLKDGKNTYPFKVHIKTVNLRS